MTFFTLRKSTILLAAALALVACGKGQQQQQAPPPPEVGVVKAQAQAVPLTRDLVGRLSATRTADVRARVAGVLQKRLYTEGTDVKEGQPMFEIDPAPLKAALNAQLANLASAQATYTNNHVAAERARSVADKGLLSKTDRDNAEAAERTAAAAVKQAQATVDSARISLGYATVTAPISGRAGQQQVTEGALVGQSDATLLTTIDQIDSVYVNFTQAFGDIDSLRAAATKGSVQLVDQNKAKIELLRSDGSPCAANEPGELVHRGALVALGYWNDAARTAERFRPLPDRLGGLPVAELAVWSGDTVRADEDGYLYFIGRGDDMIKTSGYRVSPSEVEEAVYASGLVAEAAAFGIPHPVLGQAIAVVAASRPGGAVDGEALLAACKRVLPAYMVPARLDIRAVPLPRNANGKIDRAQLAAELAANQPEPR